MEPFVIGAPQLIVEQHLGPPRRRAHLYGFALRWYRPDRAGRMFSIAFDRGSVAGIHCNHRYESGPQPDLAELATRFIPISMRLAPGYSPLVMLHSGDCHGWTLLRRDVPRVVQEALSDQFGNERYATDPRSRFGT